MLAESVQQAFRRQGERRPLPRVWQQVERGVWCFQLSHPPAPFFFSFYLSGRYIYSDFISVNGSLFRIRPLRFYCRRWRRIVIFSVFVVYLYLIKCKYEHNVTSSLSAAGQAYVVGSLRVKPTNFTCDVHVIRGEHGVCVFYVKEQTFCQVLVWSWN